MNSDKIRFNKYFYNWLYSKNGYYASYKEIGKQGDFYTSVSTSMFFGGAIAKQILKSIEENSFKKTINIIEIGAHHGYLLADIIQFLYTLKPQILEKINFIIVERFDNLQKIQLNYLKQSFGDSINISFCKEITQLNLEHAYIIANEIFDAFSCDLVYTNQENQLQVALVNNHKISFEKCEDKKIIKHCEKYQITKGEVCLDYEVFVNDLYKSIKNFEFITFDYGDKYPRNDFSTRVYEKHKVYPIFEENLDLKSLYSKCDITYDVHFNYLIDCFKSKQNSKIEFKTQNKALVDFGILELLELLKQNVNENTYLKELQKVKLLLEPIGMGERFKMLCIKNY